MRWGKDERFVEVMKGLRGYVGRNVKKAEALDVFDEWMRVAENKGGMGYLNMDGEVYPKFLKRFSRGKFFDIVKELKGIVVRYFREELGSRISDRVLRKLKISFDRFSGTLVNVGDSGISGNDIV